MKKIEFPKWIYLKDGRSQIIQSKEDLALCDKDMICEGPQKPEQIKEWKIQNEKERLFPLAYKDKKKKAKEKK